MIIGQRDSSSSICLVAEIGNNHEGSIDRATEMIEAAFIAGADAVKLQTFVPELFVSCLQVERLEVLRRFALPDDDVKRLILEYGSRGLTLFSTPLDLPSLEILSAAPIIKISSGDITFVPLLETAARSKKNLIISTGASTLSEVDTAATLITDVWRETGYQGSLAILHCVSAYPAPTTAVNLRAIRTLQHAFPDAVIGYSDHTLGIDVAVTAAAAGARIIEKHFTLDKSFSDFRDHKLSADPAEFAQLRRQLDELDELLGSGVKAPHDIEAEMRGIIRRSVTSVRELPAGHRLELADLCIVRPGDGLGPNKMEEAVGRTLVRDLCAGHTIREDDFV